MAEEARDPRIKSLRLTATRLSLRILSSAKEETDLVVLAKLNLASSNIQIAMSLLEADTQRANAIISSLKSLIAKKSSDNEV